MGPDRTTGNKVATVSFWVVAIALAGVVAWYNFRPEVLRSNPALFGAALFMCIAAVFGARECIRTLKGGSPSATAFSTVVFWLGVLCFFALAGIMAWAVLRK
jgi:hypothetical protein